MAKGEHNTTRSPQQEDWLAKRIKAARQKSLENSTIPRREESTSVPLSIAQQRLWFLHQLQPDTPVYNIASALRISGSLDVAILREALEFILSRHEILRTIYLVQDGKPVQVVQNQWSLEIPFTNLIEYPEYQREAEVQRLILQESQYVFDLSVDVMLRPHLYRLSENEYLLFLLTHHIASDSWSRNILYKELNSIYSAIIEGDSPSLPDLPIQYSDFASWQEEWLQNELIKQDFHYWQEKLQDLPSTLQMPTDFSRPNLLNYEAGRVLSFLSSTQVEALQQISRKEGATLFMVLLAAFSLLLSRLAGQKDIVVGAPIAGRNWREVENLVGIFLGSLVLRTDLSGDLSFIELLRRVRTTTLEAYDHQNIPVEKLIEEFESSRDLNRTPLFQVFLNMIVLPKPKLVNRHNSMQVESLLEAGSNFDITLYVRDGEQGLDLKLVYRANLFNHKRMKELVNQFINLLDQIIDNPDVSIQSLSLVTSESRVILPDPTKSQSSHWYGSVQARLSEWADKSPDSVAMIDSNGPLDYQALNESSNRLANLLIEDGLEKGDVVAIYGYRTGALVGAVLGILKAGAAFLILDPAYPTTRLEIILESAKPYLLVQVEPTVPIPESLSEGMSKIRQIVFLKNWIKTPEIQESPQYSPQIEVNPNDLAYISFTSGSTGQPKGILGLHGSLSHFLPWQTDYFDLSPGDNFSMLSGLSHDPLQRDIFTSWWVGGTLCIPEPEEIGRPGYLAGWLNEMNITFAHMTPAMAQLIVDSALPEQSIPSLRYAFFVGDKLKIRDVSQLKKIAPKVSCINSYGATETQRAVGYSIASEEIEENQQLKSVYPIGKGMPDVQLIILNNAGHLTGVGELGEIHVRSPHLAKGYLGDSTLTADRFITNPYTQQVIDRLYRTGDLGRYLPDVSVEFSGRDDRQVKVRGFRVEPEEIEAIILKHSDVRQVYILVQDDINRGERLIAYIISEGEKLPATKELQMYLKKHLPDYMIPSVIIQVDTFPLTPNKKVDQLALLDLIDQQSQSGDEIVAPHDQVEFQLKQIWQEVLNLSQIGIDDNFFELGGHSLLGTRMLAQIEKVFGKELPLITLFQAPTISQLAFIVRESGYSMESASLVMIKPGDSKPPLFFVPGNVGNVFNDLGDLARHLDTNQPFYGLQDGIQNPSKIESIAAKYVEDICSVQDKGPYLLGGVCLGAVFAFEIAQQLRAMGQDVSLLALIEPVYPFSQSIRSYINFLQIVSLRIMRRLGPALGSESLLSNRDESLFGLRIKLFRNSFALRNYAVRHYPGDVKVFNSKESSERGPHKFQMDWGEIVDGNLEYYVIPGTHDSITGNNNTKIEDANMKALADQLRTFLI